MEDEINAENISKAHSKLYSAAKFGNCFKMFELYGICEKKNIAKGFGVQKVRAKL